MAELQIAGLLKNATKNPKLLVAGLAGVGVIAVMARTGHGSAGAGDSSSSTDPSTDSSLLPAGADAGAGTGIPYGDPWATSPGGSGLGFDPFGTSPDPYGTGTQTTPAMTADGCSWPPPAIPTEYTGKGAWQCDAGAWTWHWIDAAPPPGQPPGTTPGGCPLPKPTLAPALVGKYKLECKHGKWQLVAIGTTPPPNPPPPDPHPGQNNVAAGQHATFDGHRNAKGQLMLEHRQVVDVHPAAHWNLEAPTNGDTTPGKTGGMVKVRKIRGAPGHNGQVGRWLKVG